MHGVPFHHGKGWIVKKCQILTFFSLTYFLEGEKKEKGQYISVQKVFCYLLMKQSQYVNDPLLDKVNELRIG